MLISLSLLCLLSIDNSFKDNYYIWYNIIILILLIIIIYNLHSLIIDIFSFLKWFLHNIKYIINLTNKIVLGGSYNMESSDEISSYSESSKPFETSGSDNPKSSTNNPEPSTSNSEPFTSNPEPSEYKPIWVSEYKFLDRLKEEQEAAVKLKIEREKKRQKKRQEWINTNIDITGKKKKRKGPISTKFTPEELLELESKYPKDALRLIRTRSPAYLKGLETIVTWRRIFLLYILLRI